MKLRKSTPSAASTLAASLAALLLGATTASAQLVWNSGGPTDNWSTAVGSENWTGPAVWTQNSNALFDATSGTPESINVTTANIFNDITFDVDGFIITSTGAGNFTLANDLASTISVTTAGHTATINETLANNAGGISSLTKAGAGTLALIGTANNTFSGGVSVTGGTLTAGHVGSLGTGPVSLGSGTILNLTSAAAGDITYTGLSTSLSGSGTVNVNLLTGTSTRILNGNYSAFTGTWNIGVGAVAGAGKIQFNGLDNSAATLNILTNATVFVSNATAVKNSSLVLNGGDTGEALGQLRLDGTATWAGPVTLAGNMTVATDGHVGSNTTTATGLISGVIGESGGPRILSKTGQGIIGLTGANTYSGGTQIINGTLTVSSIGNTGIAAPLGTGATISFGSTTTTGTLLYTGAGETTDRVLNLAGTTGGGTVTNNGTGLLKFTSGLTATGAGAKTLTLQGTGNTEVAGAIASNSVTNVTNVTKAGTGILTLSGTSTYTGTTNLNVGTTIATNTSAFGAAGNIIALAAGGSPTLDLATDSPFSGYVASFSSNNPATLLANRATPGAALNHTFTSANLGNNTFTFAAGSNVTSGTAQFTIGSINYTAGGAGTATLNPTTATVSIPGAVNIGVNAAAKTLNLGGINAGNSIAGNISNGVVGTIALTKSNTSTWTLSGNNTYTGATTVTGGILRLDYTNDTSRLPDASVLVLGGGTVELSGGTHTELVASTTLTAGTTSTVTRSSGTGVLALGTVTPGAGAVVNFTGNSIATISNANVNGILGSWATVTIGGSTEWAVNSGGFVTAFSAYNTISRLGGVIPDLASAQVLVANGGTSGDLTTAVSPATIASLKVNASDGPATIALPAGTLSVGSETNGGIWQTATSPGLTIGTVANEGFLTTGATVNATAAALNFLNDNAGAALTVNSVITNNGTDVVSIGKAGAGRLNLNGTNTFSGSVVITQGSVVLGSASALGIPGTTSTLTLGAGTLLDLNGNNAAAYNHTGNATAVVTDNASGTGTSILTLGNVGAGVPTNFLDGATRKLALRVTNSNAGFLLSNAANTLSGGIVLTHSVNGTRMSPGTITAGAYGTGPITIGEAATDRAGIYFATANQTLTNPIVLNTGLGSDRFGVRSDVAGTSLSGLITANSDAVFSSNGTGGALILTNKVTGAGGLALDLSQTTTANTVLNVTLNNAAENNDYQGNTIVGRTNATPAQNYAATLTLGRSNQIPNGASAGNVILNNNTATRTGTLNLAGFNETINGLSGNGVVTSSAGTPTLTIGDNEGDTSAFTGSFTGTLALTKIGSSALTLSTANTYTGLTTLNGGTVKAGIASALGTAAAGTVVNAGATFDFNGFALSAEAFNLVGGKLTNTGADQQNAANGAITVTANSSIGGINRWDVRTGASSLTVNSGITLTKTDANLVSVVGRPMVNDGTIVVDTGVFAFHLTGSYGGTGTYTVNSAGSIQLGTYGSATPATLPNAVTSNGGTLWAIDATGVGGSPVFSGAITLADATTTTLRADQAGIVSGVISGPGSVTKTGASVFSLTGANTYTGNTTVSAGTLSVSNASFASTSTVSVATGAVLNLNFVGTDTVASLVLNGVAQAGGVYDSTNTGGLITGSGTITVPVTGPTLGSFTTANFNAEEQGDPLVSGPTVDFDGDGVSNVLEYAFGMNPKVPSRANLPVANTVPFGGSTYVGCVYTRVKGATDLTFAVQFSDVPDSSGFTTAVEGVGVGTYTLISTVDNGTTETITLRDNTPVTAGNKRFVRILVTYP